MRKRSNAFLVRMNSDEIEMLANRVKGSGLSREEYIRRILKNEKDKPRKECLRIEKAK